MSDTLGNIDMRTITQPDTYNFDPPSAHETSRGNDEVLREPEFHIESRYYIGSLKGYGKLKKKIEVLIDYAGYRYIVRNDELNIIVQGDSAEEGLEEFCEFFISDYENLNSFPNEKLHHTAKALLERYKSYI